MPEELVVGPTDLSTALLDRTKQVSLVFGRPEGVPFTFLTWNLARWGEGAERALAGGTFEHLPLSEHADLIWEYDIVALQEVWQISTPRSCRAGQRAPKRRRARALASSWALPRLPRASSARWVARCWAITTRGSSS
ncbi:MAG: hypothetical protein R3B99_14455 [Polyangiales bacterium]